MIPALTFIPPNDVVDAFERLIEVIRNQYGDEMMEFSITLKILTLAGSEETQLQLNQFSQFKCGICFTKLMKSYLAQVTIWRVGIGNYREFVCIITQTFGSL